VHPMHETEKASPVSGWGAPLPQAGASLTTGTATSGFVVLGKCFLDPFFFFLVAINIPLDVRKIAASFLRELFYRVDLNSFVSSGDPASSL